MLRLLIYLRHCHNIRPFHPQQPHRRQRRRSRSEDECRLRPHQAQSPPVRRQDKITASSVQKIELAKGLRCKDMSEVKATVSLPVALAQQVQEQIQAGWFPDLDSLVVEALRRYLESHRDELMEHFIRRDLEWGLQGDD